MLPEDVIDDIWTSWFEQPQLRETWPHFTMESRIWHNDATKFAKHDIVFEFRDYRGTTFNLRCSAQDFLTSPWSAEGQDTRYAQFVSANPTDSQFILGMVSQHRSSPTRLLLMAYVQNFFWAALLKMNATHRGSRPVPGRAHPYVQLAPQRIIHDGQRVGTAWDLGLHKYLSPRQLAEVRDQPEIYADP